MKKINTSDWKEFNFNELFIIERGESMYIADSTEGSYPYVSASSNNNGISLYVDKFNRDGNYISINYDGSVGDAFFQSNRFFASEKTATLRIKNHILTERIALFLITLIKREKFRFSYGRKWAVNSVMPYSTLKIPVKSDGNPDWQYMENYIKSLHSKPITTTNKSVASTVDTTSWQEFKFKNLISSISKAKAHTKEEVEECPYYENDAIPFVSRTESNNSVDIIVHSTDLEGIEKGNAIVIGDTTSTISYQAEDFVAGDHIVVIRAPWLTLYTGLFIVSVLRKERYRYSYGRAYTVDLIKNTILKLPTTAEGKPDWVWMENYIKSLPFSDRINP